MNIDVENYPISDLTSRFSIKKQALYNRLDALNIRPMKVGNRAYVNATQLKLLDELHNYLQVGKTMAEFKAENSLDLVDSSSGLPPTGFPSHTARQDSGLAQHNPGMLDLITAISKIVEVATPQRSPLWYAQELENAIKHSWWLTTGEIRQLIGVKPVAKKGEQTYRRGTFMFTKEGKLGNQTLWRVNKISTIDR